MSQTVTAATCCHRAPRSSAASTHRGCAACAGFVAVFAHALVCCRVDRLLIPMHD